MTLYRTKGWRRAAAFALAVIIFGAAGGIARAEGGDETSKICETAFWRCVGDAIMKGIYSGGLLFLEHMAICLTGYDFCEKYIAWRY